MDANKLVRMANQIAANFDYGADQTHAVAGVLDHLTRFWTMAMKRRIVEYQQQGETGLSKISAEAVTQLADSLGDAA